MIDNIRDFSYIPADPSYDTINIYNYIFENTHLIPVIDINKGEIINNRLPVNRKIGINLRNKYKLPYLLRLKIEIAFNIL